MCYLCFAAWVLLAAALGECTMLSVLQRQAESYRRTLQKVQAKEHQQWEDQVAPEIESREHEIQELQQQLRTEREERRVVTGS